MDPPQCVQNAMMKQTKKPFTYTPGGIDLSEIKSPRMQRRIERNTNYDGVSDVPQRAAPHPQNTGPLPPSALAAMQPQLQVQVFPSGPPPPGVRNGPPPPPPPPVNIPPPPPLQPLPTQKVTTADNQVIERPDMTKIIPDNPMALLKKTGGPQTRKSFVDEMYNVPQTAPPPSQVRSNQQRSPPIQQQQPQQSWSPPVQQQWSPPNQQPQQKASPPVQQQWSPPSQQQQKTPPSNRWSPPSQQQWSPPAQQSVANRWQPPDQSNNIQPTTIKTSTAQLGSLYIPPANQQQQQRNPPSPPERQTQSPKSQSPSTPTLKEAPRPWQAKQPQPELPPWAKKDPPAPTTQQFDNAQSPQVQHRIQAQSPRPQSRPTSAHIELQQPHNNSPAPFQQQQQYYQPSNNNQQQSSAPNAVFITQPVVMQHPGAQPNMQSRPQVQQSPRQNAQGARVIPVQIEGSKQPVNKFNNTSSSASPTTPPTPGNDRTLNRQQSWNSTPTQSNAFKRIQKITQTDGDEDDENEPIVEYSPRYPQQFQQAPADQMRKMKMSEGDRNLVNRFKQGVDDDTSLHNEVDPRYRGSAIPSKAFKFLQSMTDGPSDNSTGAAVSRSSPSGNATPHIRTIPIQIEGNNQPQPYVHPSQQTVPEPKKYTGSSIPSRSFKILQAMTAPDTCANANEVNENIENYDPSSYTTAPWGYDPNTYPPPNMSPYWHDYYYNYPYPNPGTQNVKPKNDLCLKNSCQTPTTPVPFWNYYPPPYPYMPQQRPLKTPTTDTESDCESTARATPQPFWGYYNPYYAATESYNSDEFTQQQDSNNSKDESHLTNPGYPPPSYWDPYYYNYYYGYPPMYSSYPYPFYGINSDGEEATGYSSTEEMAFYNNQPSKNLPPAKPVAVTVSNEEILNAEADNLASDASDAETEVDEESEKNLVRNQSLNGLQAIKSVKDIQIYAASDPDSDSDEPVVDECSESTIDDDSASIYVIEDETVPHELSVIYEESERSETSNRTDHQVRESSVVSDSTTVADRSDDEEVEETASLVSVKLPLSYQFSTKENGEETTTVIVGETKTNKSSSTNTDGYQLFVQSKLRNGETPVAAETKNIEDDEDWWGILKKDDDGYVEPPNLVNDNTDDDIERLTDSNQETAVESLTVGDQDFCTLLQDNETNNELDSLQNENDSDTSSTSSSDSSSSSKSDNVSKESAEEAIEESKPEDKESSSSDDSSSDEDDLEQDDCVNNNVIEETIITTEVVQEPLSIKERIKALKESIQQKQNKLNNKGETEIKICVREKVSAIEVVNASGLCRSSKTTSTKSSVKSFEEFSEEEGDSGVTSDMSRYISDNEDFPELKKMTRYQRAATHSRLFKLLQDECDDDEDDDENEVVDKFSKLSVRQQKGDESTIPRQSRDHLSLPLKTVSNPESFSSSGINSPGSPVNEKLVTELVQSMLKRKKGQAFRSMPKEKLQAAAKKILQEDMMDELDAATPDDCSSFLSPLRNDTESSTPAQTPQEFYSNNGNNSEYKQYYDSWKDAELMYDQNYDILPSKAFKLLQEHSGLNKTGAIAGLLAKCPKVLSSKNVHEELMKLMRCPDSPSPDKSLEPNEVTSAS